VENTQPLPKIGKGKYLLTEYEKIKRITISSGDEHLLCVTTEIEEHRFDSIPKISLFVFVI
jgi:hypothetical protein